MEIIKNGGGKRGVDTDITTLSLSLALFFYFTCHILYIENILFTQCECVLYTRVYWRARRSQAV